MSLIRPPVMQFENTAGVPWALATAYFYETGTTTPVIVYEDDDFLSELGTSVQADSSGMFPAIYTNPVNGVLRMKVVKAGGSLAAPDLDIDPVNEVTASLTADDINTALGYTPVDPDNAILGADTANPQQIFTPTVLNTTDLGYRHNRTSIHDADYTLQLDDSQGTLVHDDTSAKAWTIPPHSDVAFPLGTHIRGHNLNTGVVTLTRGAGVTLRKVGAATNQNWAIAEWGFFEMEQVQEDVWQITASNGLT